VRLDMNMKCIFVGLAIAALAMTEAGAQFSVDTPFGGYRERGNDRERGNLANETGTFVFPFLGNRQDQFSTNFLFPVRVVIVVRVYYVNFFHEPKG
jgi:hypothetical protein